MRRPRAAAALAASLVLLAAVGVAVTQAHTFAAETAPTAPAPTSLASTKLAAAAAAAAARAKRPKVNAPGPSGSQRGTGTDAVALTFDDGPDPDVTPKLLDLLKKYDVKATFCLVGHRVRDNKQLVRRIADEGHTLCNHSWQHLEDLRDRADKYMFRDLEATNEQLHKAAPGAPIKYFRAPYGNFSPKLVAFAAKLGMTALYWDVDDQCYLTAKYGTDAEMRKHMFNVVKRDTRKGSIILTHDNRKPFTITAYETILPWLKKKFTLVPLPTV